MGTKHPKPDIAKLREIGWSLWDPIGLNTTMGGWKDRPFEDEYDTYLVKAAGMLRNQHPIEDVVEYLFVIETDHIGLSGLARGSGRLEYLRKIVQAISDDPSIWSDGLAIDPKT